MNTCDYNLFLTLNFDGGAVIDRIMLTISGTAMWIPLYLLILWLVWRKVGWKNTLVFVILLALAIGMSDIISGIFKHTGPLKNLMPDFAPRLRPMFTPELEGVVHYPPEAIGGLYGTVSAHAATIVTLTLMSIAVIRRWWFAIIMIVSALIICYSRIYLAKHFPIDIALGTTLGLISGGVMLFVYHKVKRNR